MPTPSKRIAKRITKRVAAPPRDLDERDIDDEDEDVTTPSVDGERKLDPRAKLLRPGWTEGQKNMDATSSFAQAFKPEEKSKAIKFLQDSPYASFRRHWVDRQTKDGKVTRAYTCLESVGEECPLCEMGLRPQAVSAFNVAECGDDGQVLLRSWDVGARLFQTLKGYANDPKIGPLTKGFYVVSRTGKKSTTSYNVIPVRAGNLEEDYDIPVPSDEDLAGLVLYTMEIVSIPTRKDMQELADELVDEI
jgi:hypothetical protein